MGGTGHPVDEAHEALARADEALARVDLEGVVAHLSTAVRAFTAADDPRAAALACVRLGDALGTGLGNQTAARAWFARAQRLVGDLPPCVEQGWVAVAAMGCDVNDADELLARAELALDRARRFGDLNLETKALADAGLAHVQAGRISQGMALLDEAMALACGPTEDRRVAAKSVCSFFTACYFAADFGRAADWTDLLRRQGLLGAEPFGPAYLSSHCDSVQATLLMELGRFGEAETGLVRAQKEFRAAFRSPTSWHPDIALADLRTRQGRWTDAEQLLLGKDAVIPALLPMARLHVGRGDHALALAAVERGLRLMGDDRLRAAELLTIAVDAHLAAGDLEQARRAGDELAARVAGLDVLALRARAARAEARILAAEGAFGAAVERLQDAIDELVSADLPWLRAVLLVQLARVHDAAGEPARALDAARSADAAFGALDAAPLPADRALLDRLLAGAPVTARLSRDGDWWSAACDGTTVRLRDTKGLRYLAELVAAPGVERHVLDLVDRVEGVDAAGGIDRRRLGDSGSLLDGQARSAYRHRIEALRSDIEDALAEGRLEAAEQLQAELDELVRQLAHAFGLGGRSRAMGSVAERARLNVTRAVRSALGKLAGALPEAGAALDRHVRTGFYCAYEPQDGEIRWLVRAEPVEAEVFTAR